MKRSCNFILALCFASLQVGAQVDRTDSNGFALVAIHSVGPQFELQTGTNSIPAGIVNRFIFGGFIKNESIDNFESNMPSSLRGGAAMRFEISNKGQFLWTGKGVWKHPRVSVFHEQNAGFQINDDAFRLIFKGNGAYLGQTLNAKIDQARRFSTYGLNLQWAKRISSGGSPNWKQMWWSISPTILKGYSEINAFTASVLTDSLAQNINVDWGGNIRTATLKNGIAGWGMLAGFGYRSTLSSPTFRSWSIELKDFGAFKINSLKDYSRMSPPGAGSINISTSFATLTEIFGGEWFKGRRDSLIDKMEIDSNSGSKWVLSPFQIKFGLEFKKFIATMDWRNLPGYIPSLKMQGVMKPIAKSSAFKWAPGLTLGGFDTWNIDLHTGLDLKPRLKGGFSANASLLGIESLALPGKQHGLGVRAGVLFSF